MKIRKIYCSDFPSFMGIKDRNNAASGSELVFKFIDIITLYIGVDTHQMSLDEIKLSIDDLKYSQLNLAISPQLMVDGFREGEKRYRPNFSNKRILLRSKVMYDKNIYKC